MHRLLQALAEAPQLLLADPAGGPQEAGDERGRRGDLGPHVRPGPAASAARPGLRGQGRPRATAARRGRDGAGLLCWRWGWTHGRPAPPGSARWHRLDAAPPLRPTRRSLAPTEITGETRGRAHSPALPRPAAPLVPPAVFQADSAVILPRSLSPPVSQGPVRAQTENRPPSQTHSSEVILGVWDLLSL